MSGVRLSRTYLPRMKQRNWGRIIFISSESALQIPVESVQYGMSKAAEIAVARGIAEDCARPDDGQQRTAWAHAGSGRPAVRRPLWQTLEAEVEDQMFKNQRHIPHQALRAYRGGRLPRRLCRKPAVLRDHRRRVAGRRWRRKERVLISADFPFPPGTDDADQSSWLCSESMLIRYLPLTTMQGVPGTCMAPTWASAARIFRSMPMIAPWRGRQRP